MIITRMIIAWRSLDDHHHDDHSRPVWISSNVRSVSCVDRIDLADGDLVLINTGRFHGVEPYGDADGDDDGDGGDDKTRSRLSGQCWLSYRKGKPLRQWV